MSLSNQGRELDQLLDDLAGEDLEEAARIMWQEVGSHPDNVSCACPIMEALAVLYERGYRLVKTEEQ